MAWFLESSDLPKSLSCPLKLHEVLTTVDTVSTTPPAFIPGQHSLLDQAIWQYIPQERIPQEPPVVHYEGFHVLTVLHGIYLTDALRIHFSIGHRV